MWYIKCANVTITKYILSEDIDLYDPKMKEKLRGDQRVKFMNERKGKLLKFLENELKIVVGPMEHCCDYLNLR